MFIFNTLIWVVAVALIIFLFMVLLKAYRLLDFKIKDYLKDHKL